MRIKIINHKENDNTLTFLNEAYLKSDIGVIGDKNNGGDRQISILSYGAYKKILDEKINGLCTSKFYANIIIDDFSIDDLKIDDIFEISQSQIQIIETGKRCFKECELVQNKMYCPLLKGVAFGRVIKDGIIKIEDKINLLKKD